MNYSSYSLRPAFSRAAITSFIVSIFGCVPLLTGATAIVFGIIAIRATTNGLMRGRGLAIAGLVLGTISLVLWGAVGSLGIWAWVASSPSRALGYQFIADLNTNNLAAATAESTSQISTAQINAGVAYLQTLGGAQQTKITNSNISKNIGSAEICTVSGVIISPNGQVHTFAIQTLDQNDVWKVNSFQIQ
ncbi:MAG: DUF4190 domain-containing protein [Planctomycetota bacterium]|nr:DUF4190 domain-containing protein [Planctomycetota bacterium]